jgi:hypothetical protein
VAVAIAAARGGMWICAVLLLGSSVLEAGCSSSSEAGGSTNAPSCTASQLSATGGRQGGGFQTAHGDIELRSAATRKCSLHEVPTNITLLRANGSSLDVRYERGNAPGSHPLLSPSGVATLIVSWDNWCGPNPGPLWIRISLPNRHGVIDTPFDGPPDYNYVPGCQQPGQRSTLQFLGYAANQASAYGPPGNLPAGVALLP